eukprot:gene3727-693_t
MSESCAYYCLLLRLRYSAAAPGACVSCSTAEAVDVVKTLVGNGDSTNAAQAPGGGHSPAGADDAETPVLDHDQIREVARVQDEEDEDLTDLEDQACPQRAQQAQCTSTEAQHVQWIREELDVVSLRTAHCRLQALICGVLHTLCTHRRVPYSTTRCAQGLHAHLVACQPRLPASVPRLPPCPYTRPPPCVWAPAVPGALAQVHLAHFEDRVQLSQDKEEAALLASPQGPELVSKAKMKELLDLYKIENRTLFAHSMIVLTGCILLFFLQSLLPLNLNLAWVATIGFLFLIVLSGVHHEFEKVLEHVELGTLLFFGALFVLMEALIHLGLIDWIGGLISSLISVVPESGQLTVALLILLWASAVVSAFVDNIPYTAGMVWPCAALPQYQPQVPVIIAIAAETGLPLRPLTWALGFGTCLGGNGTLIGASANVVTADYCHKERIKAGIDDPISFNYFFKRGFPMMIGSVFVAMIYLLVAHSLIGWNVPD